MLTLYAVNAYRLKPSSGRHIIYNDLDDYNNGRPSPELGPFITILSIRSPVFNAAHYRIFQLNPYCYEILNPTKHHIKIYNQLYQLTAVCNLFSATLIIFQWFINISPQIRTLTLAENMTRNKSLHTAVIYKAWLN